MKLNVYEYTIKDSKAGKYTGSYTVIAGCPNEAKLQNEFHSKKVDSFEHTTVHISPVEKLRIKMTLR